jgi:hypothetical protein
MDKPRSFLPIIAALLLVLPTVYVGIYVALVIPGAAMPYRGVEADRQAVAANGMGPFAARAAANH